MLPSASFARNLPISGTEILCWRSATFIILDAVEARLKHAKPLTARPETTVADSDSDDLAEVFSPPRVVPWARAANLKASLSVDVLTGTDLLTMAGRASMDLALLRNRPLLLVLSPPCTMYSILTWSFQHGRTPADMWNAKMRDASALLTLAMQLAARQVSPGRYFVFEHPATAKSWHTVVVQNVAALTGVRVVTFDQCRYGLVSPGGQPLRKRTSFMTNCSFVAEAFDGKRCQCKERHRQIIGAERGRCLSAWAAHYPPALCRELAVCARLRRQCELAQPVV